MSEIDSFSILLFEEAKRFLEKATAEPAEEGRTAYLHASLLLGISSLEAHINAIADELLLRKNLSVLDRSMLAEKDFIIDHGTFTLRNNLKIYRTIDRIELIHNSIGTKKIDYTTKWWTQVNNALTKRNSLVHPKENMEIKPQDVQQALEGVIGCLNSLYLSLYKKKFPSIGRGLHSNMGF